MLAVMVVCAVACGSVKPEVDDQQAVREYDPDSNIVYIEDEDTALSGSIVGPNATAEEIQRAAELKAIAVKAFDACNAKRTAAGLPAYVWSDGLAIAAQTRAKECVSKFSHTRPDGSDYWTVNGNLVYAENLAKGYSTAETVVDGWMNSTFHKANIMDTQLRTMGIAIYEENGTFYWAQEFGY